MNLVLFVSHNRNTLTDEGIELVLTVMEAKDLIGPSNVEQFDTYTKVWIIPEDSPPLQTKVRKIFFLFSLSFQLCYEKVKN